MLKLVDNFKEIQEVPMDLKKHPDSVQIFGIKLFKDASFISIPIISQIDPNSIPLSRFYCHKCRKWLKLSNTIGNIRSHLKC